MRGRKNAFICLLLTSVIMVGIISGSVSAVQNPDTLSTTELEDGRITYPPDIFDVKEQTWRKNQNFQGNKLTVAGRQFTRGFITHANSDSSKLTSITLDIKGLGYNYLSVYLGIDDAQGDNGSCNFIISSNGDELYKSPVLYGYDEEPKYVSLDISGVETLVFSVTNGGDGYSSDWGVWGEPTLYKSEKDVPVEPFITISTPQTGSLCGSSVQVGGRCAGGDEVRLVCGGVKLSALPDENGSFSFTFKAAEGENAMTLTLLKAGVELKSADCTVYCSDTQTDVKLLENADIRVKVGVCGSYLTVFSIQNVKSGAEWLSMPCVIPLVSRVSSERINKKVTFSYTGCAEGEGDGMKNATFSFSCDQYPLTLNSVWEYGGSGAVRHHIDIINTGSAELSVSYQPTFSGTLGFGDVLSAFTVGKGGGTPGDVGIYEDALGDGDKYVVLTDKIPIAFIHTAKGEGIYVAHEYGAGKIYLRGSSSGAFVQSGLGENFKTRIPAGDTLYVPTTMFGTYKGTQDDASHELIKWLYEYNIPDAIRAEGWPDVMFNVWNSVGGAYPSGTNIQRTFTSAKQLGIDRVILDYGWWDKVGEWTPSKSRFGGSMAKYGQYAKDNELYFVLYFLFHNGNSSLDGALSAKTHPEWFCEGTNEGAHADLGDSDCVEFIKTSLANALNSAGIPGFRSDFSPVMSSSIQKNRHIYGVDTEYWCYAGFYEILDYLYENVENFSYENCCGGGNYKDFATMKRTANIFSTDTYRVIDARRSFYDTSYCYPACQIAPQISFTGNNPDIWDPMSLREKMSYGYIYRSVMLGAMYLNLDEPIWEMDADEYDFLCRQIQIYKEWIRPLVVSATLYHTTSRPDNVNWDAMQYYDAQTGKGIMYIFKPDNAEKTMNFKFSGLDENAFYYVKSEETQQITRVSGEKLMTDGFDVTLEEIYSSDLLYIQRTDVKIDGDNIAWENASLETEVYETEALTETTGQGATETEQIPAVKDSAAGWKTAAAVCAAVAAVSLVCAGGVYIGKRKHGSK